ncbi:MAG: amino acid ABC transporter permease [bacterium]|nr:MAG: amino acid ABC transporter permease [bacterium]
MPLGSLKDLLHNPRFRHAASWTALVVILAGLVAGTFHTTKRVDYIWRWEQIPRYVLFKDSRVVEAEDDATVVALDVAGGDTVIVVKDYLDMESYYEVPSDLVNVAVGQEITRGQVLAQWERWKPGLLLQGLVLTLEISVLSIALGIFIGLFTGLARLSKSPAPKWLAIGYIELIRGTPLLVQIYIFYFFVGQVFRLSNFMAGVLALSVFAGAYVAEIFRAGIQSIHRGQMEAARSLGMSYALAMRYIILPQAFKRILPPLAGQFISLIKDSSLVGVIALVELTRAGREIGTSTINYFEVFFTVAALYLILTFSLSMLVQFLERRFAVSD